MHWRLLHVLKAESSTQVWLNKNSPILTEVSHWWYQFIINDFLADLSVRQHQSPCCAASCCYSFIWVSHLSRASGEDASKLRQNLLSYKENRNRKLVTDTWKVDKQTRTHLLSTSHVSSYPWWFANCWSETCYPAGTWQSSEGSG